MASTSTEVVTVALPRIPRINDPAPDFEARSTHGIIRLSDYTSKGKWVLLFSHPADFTPVCTTEFVEFARHSPEFEQRNVQLVGTSVDSVYSHIAWVRSIEANFKTKISFPVIADLDQRVARLFGMVHEPANDTATVRAVFFIDPNKTSVRSCTTHSPVAAASTSCFAWWTPFKPPTPTPSQPL
jgi:peroxiredoxin (alkyl hydroperoxide reductase subunit C)